MNAIEFQNASFGFGTKSILNNLTASIPHGSFVGIFGPNGAGKTLMLRTILGLTNLIDGKILIYGTPPKRGLLSIGYLPQFHHELESFPLSGRSFLSAAAQGCRWGFPFLNKKQNLEIEEVIQLVELQDYIDRPFMQYSGGERQRLGLALALLGKPKILLLDEPLSALDPGQQERIIKLIHSIQKALNFTVLMTGHNINPLIDVMDNIIYLSHGQAAIGTVDEVVNTTTLSQLYNTPVEVIRSGNNVWIMPKNPEKDDHDGCT